MTMMTTLPSDLVWTKSSYSGGNSDCVEVAHGVPGTMPVRDSKNPAGAAIVIPAGAWTTFVDCVKTGDVA
ncbi:DUF397 domain-containing protein [Streptomyces sp. NPDC058280]|uniref:DUF397 domain-containing protein n=1 Tax=Streptomyces sp. NPDC058280 TaxID=3346419 RepID=UPI0036E8A98A